ncbi:MAG: hypothetical protein Q4C45_05015 [Oscillospiraceae bacterium]|nr:hypothetical protein [Oscillospiraceae bacterium]
MSVQEILLSGGGFLFVLMTLVQIAPIKVNPWSAIAKAIGRAINADVLKDVSEVKKTLDDHIRVDDERNADAHRTRILQFNNELIRQLKHTREDFIEVLAEIDFYEKYCREHPEYPNSRAVHAIANIERVYDDRLKKGDFADNGQPPPERGGE